MLQSQDCDLCWHNPFSKFVSEDEVKEICADLYKKDVLSIFSNAVSDFQRLVLIKGDKSEIFCNLESRFTAFVPKINSYEAQTLCESVTAFMLLSNSKTDTDQGISILSMRILKLPKLKTLLMPMV